MPVAWPEPQEPRVIAHVDMDCFYVQVEQRRHPELRGLPTAVVQYNSWKGGGLIALADEARKFGVKRSMRGDEAKKICPNINLVQVPVAREKADLNVYRSAGSEVVAVLATKGRCERASIDEVYLDLTDAAKEMLLEAPPELSELIIEEATKSNILGLSCDVGDREKNVRAWLCQEDADYQDKLLACGAIVVAQLRVKVLEETQFTCSAGIAHNKMLAKLASGMHKPAQQTVVPSSSVQDMLASLPVKKMKQLGGKLGSSLQTDLGINTVGDLRDFTEEKLQEHYGVNTGTWLWKMARGMSGEEVQDRLLPKSHGCGKTFPGPKALKNTASVKSWLDQLCEELSERIQSDMNQKKRVAHTLTIHARACKEKECDSTNKFPSKSCPLRYGTSKIQEDAMKLFQSGLHDFLGSQNTGWSIMSLSITASKIFDIPSGTSSILRYLHGSSSNISPDILDSSSKHDCHYSPYDGSSNISPDIVDSSSNLDDRSSPYDGNKLCMTPVQEEQCEHSSKAKEDCSRSLLVDQNKTNEGKGMSKNLSKVKGTCSILRFLSQSNSSPHEQRKSGCLTQDHPDPGSSSGADKAEPHDRSTASSVQRSYVNTDGDHLASSSSTWKFNVEDIDASVVDELPLEIQREVRGWIHASKRTRTNPRGSTISSYFPPARKQ